MSDTPRTDAYHWKITSGSTVFVPVAYARQLERELAVALAQLTSIQECAADADYYAGLTLHKIAEMRRTYKEAK